LIDRIKRLVAEQRAVPEDPESERSDANRREIDRLQRQLAAAVKHDLEARTTRRA
jgi:hypothetical protein